MNGALKERNLQYVITLFAMEVGTDVDQKKYNKAWDRLWSRIKKLKLFAKDGGK